MLTKFYSLFAALSLAICLQAPEAAAAVSVTATQVSGHPGGNVNVTLTVGSDGSSIHPDEVDLSQISGYTFNLLWNPAVLEFKGVTSDVQLEPFTTMAAGSVVTNWFDSTFISPVDFSSGVNITANFNIYSGAAYGTYEIVFGDGQGSSNLTDIYYDGSDPPTGYFSFSDVSDVNQRMQVTVMREQVPQIPEPAEISMLLSGLGVMALAIRRRKNRKA